MKQLRIGLDVDCVLNNLHEEWIQWIWDKFQVDFPIAKWTSWDLLETIPPEIGTKVYDFLDEVGAFYRTEPLPGSVEVTREWVEQGHDLIVATTTHPRMWDEKSQWLAKFFPHIDRHNQIAIARKGLLNLDVLIDDGIHNFKEFAGKPIVFNRPWNQEWNKHMAQNAAFEHFDRAARVNDWNEIKHAIAEMAVERKTLFDGD